jgi:hypothetical protein
MRESVGGWGRESERVWKDLDKDFFFLVRQKKLFTSKQRAASSHQEELASDADS